MRRLFFLRFHFILLLGTTIFSQEGTAQIILTSSDSLTTMRIRAGFQVQYEYLYDGDSSYSKPTLERARLIVTGKALVRGLSYFLQFAGDPSQRDVLSTDPNKNLLDAWIQYKFTSHFGLRIGQYNMPALRQGYTSIMFQQFSNRSIVSGTFTYNRDLGLLAFGKLHLGDFIFKPYYMFVTGEGRSFIDITQNNGNQHIFKLELLTGGEFTTAEGYTEADLDREGHPKISLSMGYEINNNPLRKNGNSGPFYVVGTSAVPKGDIRSILVDAQIKFKGFSALFEYINREADDDFFIAGNAFNFQLGKLFISNFEIAGRFARIKLDSQQEVWTERNLIFNRYFRKHDFKIQAEYRHLNFVGGSHHTLRILASVFI